MSICAVSMVGMTPKRRRVAGVILLAAALHPCAGLFRVPAARAQALAPAPPARSGAAMPPINQLWQEQTQRMAKEIGALQPRVAGRSNVYAIAIAAQGSQQLFSREAQRALAAVAARFGKDYRGGLLLANGLPELLSHPLATQDGIAAAARGVGGRIDPARDLVVVYLSSHGAPEALISTDLPNRATFPPITSAALAAALSQAGIKRRVVIVSACFAASWTPALANDDTIIVTASAKDRTSFGCDDRRRLTYFGEAFLEGPLERGASLRDAFESARRTVTRWETDQQMPPSLPEASVGKNMQALWVERAGARK